MTQQSVFNDPEHMARYGVREKVWLVGEHNPIVGDQRYALYPLPAKASGARLCRMLGLEAKEYLMLFERRNLLSELPWSAPKAREAARAILSGPGPKSMLLCGARVCAAFDVDFEPFEFHEVEIVEGVSHRVGVIPHPSGRARGWNEAGSMERARAVLAKLRAA